MHPHPLDMHVWSSLQSRHHSHAITSGGAVRYEPTTGVFAAAADWSSESLAGMLDLVRDYGDVALLENEPPPAIPGLQVVSSDAGVQMVAEALLPEGPTAFQIQKLGAADAADMLALAHMTQPGPFFQRTHLLGDFFGVRLDGVLVAMAGERMKPLGHTEVSGVCTHPGHRGASLGSSLLLHVAHRIAERGDVPFLHAYASNKGAIALYERLGFVLTRRVAMTRLGLSA